MEASTLGQALHDGDYAVRRSGRPYTNDYRVFFERVKDRVPVSPFHDIPLYHDKDKGVLNMVVEVPRWTNAKFEITRDERLNPIHQDTLDDAPRFTKNCFPYKGYMWNYGALPQTWEDPRHRHPDTRAGGDNDPLDACEVGRRIARTGDVRRVRPLGVLALLDGGRTDWKVLVVDVRDPLADRLHDVADVEAHLPGLLDATRDWFRIYKVPDGQGPNDFAFGGRWKGRRYAEKVIEECADAWRELVGGKAKRGDISIDNTTLSGTPGKLDPDEVHLPPDEDLSPAPIEEDLNEWHYLDRVALDAADVSLEQGSLDIVLEMC